LSFSQGRADSGRAGQEEKMRTVDISAWDSSSVSFFLEKFLTTSILYDGWEWLLLE
jgi:hypothetical protein